MRLDGKESEFFNDVYREIGNVIGLDIDFNNGVADAALFSF